MATSSNFGYRHTLPPKELDLKKALHEERHLMQRAHVPIVTVSATYRKELADKYLSVLHTASDVIYSRAHYSMGEALVQQARVLDKKVHLVDPTNFVGEKDWGKIEITERIGQLMARHKMLKAIKDKIDTIARSRLPITKAITLPLLYLTDKIKRPIISLHYEAGNILVEHGFRVIQVITDPHVRPQYLDPLPSNLITYCVFDEATKDHFIQLAGEMKKEIDPKRIVVTGPPVDPRITKLSHVVRVIKNNEPLRLGVTTGGLGTNFEEIKSLLDQLSPLLKPPEKIRLFLHAGTHRDFRNFFEEYASLHHVRIGDLDDEGARIRILYDDSIIDANNNLIKHLFPWAHGIITKPSGDMTYDAAAAGCFLLFLEPWGEWEVNIQDRFMKNGAGFDLNVSSSLAQIKNMIQSGKLVEGLEAANKLPGLFRNGAKNILKLHEQISETKNVK